MIKWEPGERIKCNCTPVATGIPVTNEWEVVAKGRIKVLQCNPHFASYLEVGKEYELLPHPPESYLQLWEIPVESTKQPESASQVLLYDWNDTPDAKPSMEIDF
ncbi:MAG: hypothetical protein DWQ19_10240 [Crenarchaeota archaeon]|nr:MAG: hypothetical protein DWQ19_10240 [Thermoproteota archaeon]